MPHDYEATVQALVKVGPPMIRDSVPSPAGVCIQATRIGIEALAYFGVRAQPLAVWAGFMNDIEWAAIGAGTAPAQASQLAGAIGVSIGRPDGGVKDDGVWNGHLIVQTEGHMIDLDSGGASRPDRGFIVPPGLLLRRPPELPASYTLEGGVHATYSALDDSSWRRTPAWRVDGPTKRLTGAIIRAMRQLIES